MALRAMRQLRVMKLYHATLVRYNDKTHRLLKACEPYVTWGEPDVRTVRDLITKRGYAVVDVSKITIPIYIYCLYQKILELELF